MIGDMLREWRRIRGRSQLELALDAGVSARHLSFLESGRSQPSREMVLRLGEALGLPLRERNTMLVAAGYAPRYGAGSLEAAALDEVRATLAMMLDAHDPYPAIALDAGFHVISSNPGFRKLLEALGLAADEQPNLVELVFRPGPMRSAILNWPEVAAYMSHRLRESLRVRGSASPLRPQFEQALAQPGVAEAVRAAGTVGNRPVVPVTLQIGGETSSWITTVTTFGAPQDVFVEELMIEQFFPADASRGRGGGGD
ncbi:MAG TPA: helix-turn-helix transcriptional regulator [Devosiaceae bacterium]|jgi:transcriptional regulator with XRE-family HTH domain/predicted transcriptional regulator|nr:helix-turn-helix transcriptional regulator [Devosiaceae bacterium]